MATTKMGPDNARRVVWALDEWSFFFFFVLFATNKIFIAYISAIHKICNRGVMEGGGNQNSLKQCIWCRLGPR